MKLLIFDLEVDGHHPGYLRHLLRFWPDEQTYLHFVVAPTLAERHPVLVQTPSRARVSWSPITLAEWQWYEKSKGSLVQRAWVEWRLFCRYATQTRAEQGLIMYVDRFQLPLALGLFLPCKTSGIFFRPKLHYATLPAHRPTRREQAQAWREQGFWRRALRHRQLKTLFTLDPLAVTPLRALGGCAHVVHLPDPVEIHPPDQAAVTQLQQTLGLAPARKIFLLFGALDQRKGIYPLLNALRQLPPAQQTQITVLVVGSMADTERAALLAALAEFQRHSAVQLVLQDHFIPDEAIPHYFALADVVLALYQHHVGSSGVLLWAAAAGKAVLSSDYGLLGELVRRHHLGLTVDSSDPGAIVAGLGRFLGGQQPNFDQSAASHFAAANRPEQFVQCLWRNSTNRGH
jgi:glycosyltransferase involved in cell wall biosynthesis